MSVIQKLKDIFDAMTFQEVAEEDHAREQARVITSFMFDMVHVLGRTVETILLDDKANNKPQLVADAMRAFKESIPEIETTKSVHRPRIKRKKKKINLKGKGKENPIDEFRATGKLAKFDEAEQNVFGFFSIIEINGEAVIDKQDDIIEPFTLEKAAYDFVIEARMAGDSHKQVDGEVKDVGVLIESFVITPEKQAAMVASLEASGIEASMDINAVGWWGGFHITDKAVWDDIVKGELAAFSIGGVATRESMDAEGAQET